MLEFILQADRYFFICINTYMANPLFDIVCPYLRMQEVWYPLYAILMYFIIKEYKYKGIIIILVAALLITATDQFSAKLIKGLFIRTRPCAEPILAGKVRHLIESCRGYSFISAHATNHFALAVYLGIFLKQLGKFTFPLLLFWAFLIAFSQVYVGVHYPLDVIAGALTGVLFGNAFGNYLFRYIKKAIE